MLGTLAVTEVSGQLAGILLTPVGALAGAAGGGMLGWQIAHKNQG